MAIPIGGKGEAGVSPSHRFALQVSVNDVACEIAVNDVPVVRNYRAGRLDLMLPVSDFVISGSNRLSILTLVDRSAGGASATRASATLLATPAENSDWQQVASVRTSAVPGGEEEITTEFEQGALGPVGPQRSEFDPDIMLLENSRSVALDASVPRWAWEAAPALPEDADDEPVIAGLVEWYRWLHAALSNRDRAAVQAVLTEKISELAIAHRASPEFVADEIGLADVVLDENLQLADVAWEDLQLERAAKGRLLRLYHPTDGAVIVFVDELQLRHTFDFWLRRGSDGWIVAR